MKKENTEKHSFSCGKAVAKVCMALLVGAMLFTGCALGTGYDDEQVPARAALSSTAALPVGTWYTHLTGASAAYNVVINISAGTITYTGTLAAYNYVATIADSYAFDSTSGAYVVQFTSAPIDGVAIDNDDDEYNHYYVMYYQDYVTVSGVTTAKMADAYSTAYDPETGYTSVRRVYIDTPPTEQELVDNFYADVGWSYVDPYYLGVAP
jgi:low affinity Fe/Cu permease